MTHKFNKIIILVGPSGVGKSTYVKNILHLEPSDVINTDTYRRMLGNEVYNPNNTVHTANDMENLAWKIANTVLISRFMQSCPIVIDNTNLISEKFNPLQRYFELAEAFNYEIEVVLFEDNEQKILQRLNNEDRHIAISEEVHQHQMKNYQLTKDWLINTALPKYHLHLHTAKDHGWLKGLDKLHWNTVEVQDNAFSFKGMIFEHVEVLGDIQGDFNNALNVYHLAKNHPQTLYVIDGDYFDQHDKDITDEQKHRNDCNAMVQCFYQTADLNNVVFIWGNHDFALMQSLLVRCNNLVKEELTNNLNNQIVIKDRSTMKALNDKDLTFYQNLLEKMYHTYYNDLLLKNKTNEIFISHSGINNLQKHHLNSNCVQFGVLLLNKQRPFSFQKNYMVGKYNQDFNENDFVHHPNFKQVVGHYDAFDYGGKDVVCVDNTSANTVGCLSINATKNGFQVQKTQYDAKQETPEIYAK